MKRYEWLLVAMLVGACGDDGGGNKAGDAGSDIGDSMGGTPLISGMSCEGVFSFDRAGDERLVFFQSGQSLVGGFAILDGALFDSEDEAAWQTYAQTNDVVMVIGFVEDIPLAPGVVTDTFDSFFGARNVGIVGFADSGGSPRVEIVTLDTTAKTLHVTFDMPVGGSTNAYPPMFDTFTECDAAGHTATGSYTGAYEVFQF